MDRSRSRSPACDDRRGRSRIRARSPIRQPFLKARSETPMPGPRPRIASSTPRPKQVDRWGIPVYPEEPEPKMTYFGRDAEGKVLRMKVATAMSARVVVNTETPSRYPQVPHFNEIKLQPPPDLLSKMLASAFPGSITPSSSSSNNGSVGTTTIPQLYDKASEKVDPLQHVSNIAHGYPPLSTKINGNEEDLITFEELWTGRADRSRTPDNLIDLVLSSPIKFPHVPTTEVIEVNPFEPCPVDNWGIFPPPRTMTKDPYIVLGIEWGAGNEEVLQAYNYAKREVECAVLASKDEIKQSMQELDDAKFQLLHF